MIDMPTDRFSQTVHIAAPAARIYAHLIEPASYIGLSPLVIDVRDVHPVQDDLGRPATAYVAVERIPFGPFHWDNLIRVTMTGAVPDRQVISAVVSPGWVRLTSVVDLTPDANGTTVTESVEVRSPRLLRGFVLGQARSVQQKRVAELARRMES